MLPSRRTLLIATFAALAVAAPLLAQVYAPAGWPLDAARHAIGRDFVNLWVGGRLILEGNVAVLFDPAAYIAALHRLFDPQLPPHIWSYPPTSFLLAAPLSLLPYGAALVFWTAAGLAGFIAVARIGLRQPEADRVTALLLLAPATFATIICGQNGFLTASLLAGGFLLLERRPVVAGALLGLLSYKPHFGIMVVPALLALGAWRSIAAAAACAVALALVSTLAFGLEPWRAFFAVTLPNQALLLEAFSGFFTSMLISPYSALRHVGLAHGTAMALQVVLALATIALLVLRVRRARDVDIVLGLVTLGTFAASPYSFTYDLPVLALVLARLAVREEFWPPARAGLFAAAWALPLAAPALALAGIPVAAPILLAVLGILCARAALEDIPGPGRRRLLLQHGAAADARI
jgi:hypothetical protein